MRRSDSGLGRMPQAALVGVGSALVIAPDLAIAASRHTYASVAAAAMCVAGLVMMLRKTRWGLALALTGLGMFCFVPPQNAVTAVLLPPLTVMVAVGRRAKWSAAVLTACGLAVDLWLSRRASSMAAWTTASVLWVCIYGAAWVLGIGFVHVQRQSEREFAHRVQLQRRQIAAELHDNVAHELSLIVLRAETARRQPETADAELQFIAEQGRRTNRYLSSLMSLLRVEEDFRPLRIDATMADSDRRLREVGLAPVSSIEGDLALVPAAAADALSRIVIEATNNMARHAVRGQPCALMVAAGDREIQAAFTNAWDGTRGSGLGLLGMEERARSLGGNVLAGPQSDLWVVRVTIPYE